MIIYSIEYGYATHNFRSFEKMMKAFKSWWREDGRPFWYDETGKRTHFPTVDEVLQGIEDVDGFYRGYGTCNYVVIRKVKVQ
jgi:hypothetical protein